MCAILWIIRPQPVSRPTLVLILVGQEFHWAQAARRSYNTVIRESQRDYRRTS
jgi:hypothetical protein